MNAVASPSDECPSEQVLLDLTVGSLAPEPRRLAGEHISQCALCADSIAAALSFLAPPALENASPEAGELETPLPEPVASRRSLQPGQILRDTYRIVSFIGSGAMGEVYEARHARLVGRYAIKILNLDLAGIEIARARFRREAIASELRHPNIVQVIDFDETDEGRPYLVLEFLHGRDLGATLAQAGKFPLDRALPLVSQIAAGLAAMHRLGIVHRDLKPGNVVVLAAEGGEPERIKLVDFGLSRRQVPSLAVTHDRTLLGTPQYMAPEQARGETDAVGPAADQFAMALLFYEMLSGRPAFSGGSLAAVLYRIVHEAPVPLQNLVPGLPIPVLSAIERAMAKDPEKRFPSVRDFANALTFAPEIPRRATAERRGAVRSWLRGAAIAGCGAAAIGGALWIRGVGVRTPQRPVLPMVRAIPAAPPPSTEAPSSPEPKGFGTLNAKVGDEPVTAARERVKKTHVRGAKVQAPERGPDSVPPLPSDVDLPKPANEIAADSSDGAAPAVPKDPNLVNEPHVNRF